MADQFQKKKIASETGRTIEIIEKFKDMSDGTLAGIVAAAILGTKYEAASAGTNDTVLGNLGATNDLLLTVIITPASTSPGAVSIKDGANGAVIPLFVGGAGSVSNLVPFSVTLNARSVAGGWRITTGSNVSVIATGEFT